MTLILILFKNSYRISHKGPATSVIMTSLLCLGRQSLCNLDSDTKHINVVYGQSTGVLNDAGGM